MKYTLSKNVNGIPTETSWKYFAVLWVFSSYLICCWLSDFGFLCSWQIFTFDFVGGLLLTNDFDTYKRIFFGNILVEKYLHKGIFPLMPVIFFLYIPINFYLFWVCPKYFSLSNFVTADLTNCLCCYFFAYVIQSKLQIK